MLSRLPGKTETEDTLQSSGPTIALWGREHWVPVTEITLSPFPYWTP